MNELPCPDPEGCKHFKESIKLQVENDQLKRDMIKYGAHTGACNGEECICGFDEVKEQALAIIIEDQRR